MKSDELRKWLDGQLENFPERASGEEGYEFMIRQTQKVVEMDRAALVQVLTDWLRLRTVPRTDLAISIAVAHKLSELRDEIETLLNDVNVGKAFKPYYAKRIASALEKVK